VSAPNILAEVRQTALEDTILLILKFRQSEIERLEWDGSPGMIGNYIGGIKSAADTVQKLFNQEVQNPEQPSRTVTSCSCGQWAREEVPTPSHHAWGCPISRL